MFPAHTRTLLVSFFLLKKVLGSRFAAEASSVFDTSGTLEVQECLIEKVNDRSFIDDTMGCAYKSSVDTLAAAEHIDRLKTNSTVWWDSR